MALPGNAVPTPATMPTVTGTGRIHALDILRGFALLGMIVVHFHQRMQLEVTGLEDLIGWITWVGIETKAWGTFAFLFGVGFAILLRSFTAKGVPVVSTYLRRLLGLAVFGVFAWVFFGFTILIDYALWGLPLLFMRTWTTRSLLVAVVAILMSLPTTAAIQGILATPPAEVAPEVHSATTADPFEALRTAEAGNRYLPLVRARAATLVPRYARPNVWIPGTTLALFVLGMLALRQGVFDDPRRHVRLIIGAMTVGFISWGLAWLTPLLVPSLRHPDVTWAVHSGFGLFRDQLLCLTYIGALVLLVTYRPVWLGRLSSFGYAGRMALTNYLLQIAALDVLGSTYGVGLRVRPLLGVPCALALFGVLVLFSRVWLTHFRIGPAEWLWRTLTYLRVDPIRTIRPAVITPS